MIGATGVANESPRPPPNHPGPRPAQRRLWEVLGELGEGLEELWEALGEPVGGSGWRKLWESFGETLYIQKLPINRTSGRYVIYIYVYTHIFIYLYFFLVGVNPRITL